MLRIPRKGTSVCSAVVIATVSEQLLETAGREEEGLGFRV